MERLIKARDSIAALVDDSVMLANSSQHGNFSVRADITKHHGSYAKVVQGVNGTLNMVVDKIYWYEQLLDSIPWPLSVTDKDMNWTFVNRPVEEMLKKKRSELLGKPCSNWGANICKTKNCGIECLRSSKPRTLFEQQGMNFQVDTSYIKDINGNTIGHIEVVQDVTAAGKQNAYREAWIENLRTNIENLGKGDIVWTSLSTPDQYTMICVRCTK